jgi:hypothetical protein
MMKTINRYMRFENVNLSEIVLSELREPSEEMLEAIRNGKPLPPMVVFDIPEDMRLGNGVNPGDYGKVMVYNGNTRRVSYLCAGITTAEVAILETDQDLEWLRAHDEAFLFLGSEASLSDHINAASIKVNVGLRSFVESDRLLVEEYQRSQEREYDKH